MSDLLTVVENEPRVSHRVVAEHTENQQKNINELIKKYHDDFSEFGTLPFKTEGVINNGKGEQPKTYYLNEPQATFLMTLLRNKPIVVEFKKRLVKEFYEMKSGAIPHTQDENNLIGVVLKLVENQQKQTDAILSLVESIKQTPQLTHKVERIDMQQRKNIRELINKKVNRVSVKTGMDKQTIAPGIYIAFKNEFNLDEYGELSASLYDQAITWLEEFEPFTKYSELEKVYEMSKI